MIILRTPKGWTGPKEVDGLPTEGSFRSHQVPLADVRGEPRAPRAARGLAASLPARGALRRRRARSGPRLAALAPRGDRRMTANPHANGGLLLRDLDAARLPRLRGRRRRAGHDDERGDARRSARSCATSSAANPTTFRLFGPDETSLEPARRRLRGDRPRLDGRDRCRPTITSRPTAASWRSCREHLCQGWLEGYLLTGRHGLFNCYEAFIHIIDSMFNQHAKWLKMTREIPLAAARSRR